MHVLMPRFHVLPQLQPWQQVSNVVLSRSNSIFCNNLCSISNNSIRKHGHLKSHKSRSLHTLNLLLSRKNLYLLLLQDLFLLRQWQQQQQQQQLFPFQIRFQ